MIKVLFIVVGRRTTRTDDVVKREKEREIHEAFEETRRPCGEWILSLPLWELVTRLLKHCLIPFGSFSKYNQLSM